MRNVFYFQHVTSCRLFVVREIPVETAISQTAVMDGECHPNKRSDYRELRKYDELFCPYNAFNLQPYTRMTCSTEKGGIETVACLILFVIF